MQHLLSSVLTLLALGVGISAQDPTPVTGVEIHPNWQLSKCVEVRGGVFANGTPVQMQKWVFNQNQVQAQIRLANTNFCLDAGDNPFQHSGNKLKIWDCYSNLTQQRWYIGSDSTIKLSDVCYGQFGVCLDLTEGRLDNTNVLQTSECSLNNKVQLWQNRSSVTSSSLPPIVTSVSMTATPTGPIITPPPTYTNDYPRPGCPVYSCETPSSPWNHPLYAMSAVVLPPLPLLLPLLSPPQVVTTPVRDALFTAALLAQQL
ncbi:ricin B lectin domain-containing protein [Coprinopsis sp. MPI-PUGE-AT-0042]|nr:ricin B lectin domain-containing protein [Coprinopsis sp. MPI-PUGE-AT-0042]